MSIDEEARNIARRMEWKHNHLWMIIFGAFSKKFICFPLFAAPPGTRVEAFYPDAADERMTAIERVWNTTTGRRGP